jgi:hypothetical protein
LKSIATGVRGKSGAPIGCAGGMLARGSAKGYLLIRPDEVLSRIFDMAHADSVAFADQQHGQWPYTVQARVCGHQFQCYRGSDHICQGQHAQNWVLMVLLHLALTMVLRHIKVWHAAPGDGTVRQCLRPVTPIQETSLLRQRKQIPTWKSEFPDGLPSQFQATYMEEWNTLSHWVSPNWRE